MEIQVAVQSAEWEWVRREILEPALEEMIGDGTLVLPTRFASREETLAEMVKLFETQMLFLEKGVVLLPEHLMAATDRSYARVQRLLAAIRDWDALVHGLRYRESDRGRPDERGSVFVVKTAEAFATGPAVFGACSPAYPTQVKAILEAHGLPAGSSRPHDPALDSAVYVIEVNPEFVFVLACEVLPEGSQWDYLDRDRYPEEIRELVRKELERKAGGKYRVRTTEILREKVFQPLLTSRARFLRDAALALGVESGWLGYGPEGDRHRHRFLGGELDVIKDLHKGRLDPFFDIPRTMLRDGDLKLRGEDMPDCVFEKDGLVLEGRSLTWAARMTLEGISGGAKMRDFFESVPDAIVEMAGAEPDQVEYAIARAKAGKAGSLRKTRMGLLARYDGTFLSGWVVPRLYASDDADLGVREAVARAERHVVNLSPTGAVQTTVEAMQKVGIQQLGVNLASQRERREGLIRACAVLLERMRLHL